MPQNTTSGAKNPGHIRSFWPLVIIVVMTVLLGGAILNSAFNNELQDDLYSSGWGFGAVKKPMVANKTIKKNAVVTVSAKK